jgi:hypothetical protein
MGCMLRSKELEDIVGFNDESFAPNIKAPKLDDDLEKLDRKARAMIELRLSDSIFELAQSCLTSHELWKQLHNIYQRNSMVAAIPRLTTIKTTGSICIRLYRYKCPAAKNAGFVIENSLLYSR